MGRIVQLNPRESFVCRECGKRKGGRFFISPTLCKKCEAKRRTPSDATRTLKPGLEVTPIVEEKLLGATEEQWARSVSIAGFLVAVGSTTVVGGVIGGFVGGFMGFCIGGVLVLGILGMVAVGAPRNKHVSGVFLELAEARKRGIEEAEQFYASAEWRALRNRVVREEKHVCKICGQKVRPGDDLAVDHIKPRSKYPELELKRKNLQILCQPCNSAKGARED